MNIHGVQKSYIECKDFAFYAAYSKGCKGGEGAAAFEVFVKPGPAQSMWVLISAMRSRPLFSRLVRVIPCCPFFQWPARDIIPIRCIKNSNKHEFLFGVNLH